MKKRFFYIPKRLNTIKFRVGLAVALSFSILLLVFVLYTNAVTRQQAINSARSNAISVARDFASQISAELEIPLSTARSFATFLESAQEQAPGNLSDQEQKLNLEKILHENPALSAACLYWEQTNDSPNDSAALSQTPLQSRGACFYRENGKIFRESEKPQTAKAPWYAQVRKEQKPLISEPYMLQIGEIKQQVVTLSAPVVGEQFLGAVGLHLPLSYFQKLVEKINLYQGKAKVNILSHDGFLVGVHGRPEVVGKNIRELGNPDVEIQLANIRQKRQYTQIFEGTIEIYAPVELKNTENAWQIGIGITPQLASQIKRRASREMFENVYWGILLILALLVAIVFLINYLLRPLQHISLAAKKVAKGDFGYTQLENTTGEVQQINDAFNEILSALKEKTQVVKAITQGDYSRYVQLSGKNDTLGKSINQMLDTLKAAQSERRERRQQDKIRNWNSRGIALFADLLRKDNDNIEKLSKNIVRELCQYIDAVQGGLFLINQRGEKEPCVELMAAFAYDRHRKAKKRFAKDEGLVGRSLFEKKSIYLTDLPENYLDISSGLGEEKPASLLIVPLLVNQQVLGAIELAAFKKMENFQIEFVEKVAESIAATLESVKINIQTNRLLAESRQQSQKLSEQEEEMRQNLEEMQATQEDAARRQAEMSGVLEALNATSLVVEFDLKGKILKINHQFLELFGLTQEQVIGKNHAEFNDMSQKDKVYKQFWDDLRAGKSRKEESRIELPDKKVWLSETYTPILDTDGKPVKVLNVAFDITKAKEQEQMLIDLSMEAEILQKRLQEIENREKDK